MYTYIYTCTYKYIIIIRSYTEHICVHIPLDSDSISLGSSISCFRFAKGNQLNTYID